MRKTRFTQMVVLVCIGSLAGCTSGEGGTVGNTELNVVVPAGSAQSGPGTNPVDIQNVEYTINCSGTPSTFLDNDTPLPNDGAVQINGNLEVVDGRTDPQGAIPPEFGTARPGDGAEIWQGFMDLPVGPCTIQLRARDNDGEVICTATESFDIVADTTSKVNLVLVCDVSFQAPVGMLDVDATFSFVVGNFCPDLFVLNCNAQDESVEVVNTPFGPQAPALCEVRFRDVDSTCGQSCDPQTCVEDAEGLTCTPGPDLGVSTTITCVSTPANSAALDCDLNGVPDASCTFNGDTLGTVGGQPSGPLNPADGGFAVGFALCTQAIVDGTDPGCGIAYPCPIPVVCADAAQVGSPLAPGATMTCTAVTTDGDDDCQKTKSVTVTGPGLSPCAQLGCLEGQDCAFCDDGITCTANTCDDSSGTPVCPNEARPAGSDCSVDFGGASAECDGAGVCELLGCNSDADCPAPDGNCLGQSTCLADLTCGAQPPVNDTGACDNSGVGSGAGTCNAGTCDTADACGVAGAPACADADECNLGFCDTGLTPYACGIDPNAADGNPCNGGAGVCNAGACELPPVLGAGTGSTTTTLVCVVAGTVTVDLNVDITLTVDSQAGGASEATLDYFVLAVNPSFLLGGVAIDTTIAGLIANTDITNAAETTAQSLNSAIVPTLNLNNFLRANPPLPPNEIYLAVDPNIGGAGIPNVCDGTAATDCPIGDIPPGVDLTTQAITPNAAGTDVLFNSNNIVLTIDAVGGALQIIVDTNDPTICDPGLTSPGADVAIPAVAQ